MRNLVLCVLALVLCAMPAGALVWQWDCDVDPTTLDSNGDGIYDWVVRGGDPFDGTKLVGGKWLGGQTLDSRPLNDFAQPVIMDITWKAGTTGEWNATFWINMDYTGGMYGRVYGHLENDGTNQSLSIHGHSGEIASFSGLPNDFIDMHLYINTVSDTVDVTIDDVLKGSYSYPVASSENNFDKFATLLGGNVEFDSVRIEVIPEPATMLMLGSGLLGLLAIRRKR